MSLLSSHHGGRDGAKGGDDWLRSSSVPKSTQRPSGSCAGERRRSRELLRFSKAMDEAVPGELDIHLVLDDCATHETPPDKSGAQDR